MTGMKRERILVTGAAGFIGFHVCRHLIELGAIVLGLDNVNDYYDQQLKRDRLDLLEGSNFNFIETEISVREDVEQRVAAFSPSIIIHLAAQAGVRHSIENPDAYVDSNLIGFMNMLEACRRYPVKHLIYASSSSVYGGNTVVPFSTEHPVDHPVSLYAATKKSNELMAHTYSHLYGIPTTGLRLFTVYGPWGRPDMAYYSFTKHILEGKPIKVFNHGKMERDLTYVDDIVEAIVRLIPLAPKANPAWNEESGLLSESSAPYKIYNVGNSQPITLEGFIAALEEALGKRAEKIYMDMQPGDVPRTYADVSDLENRIGFTPQTSLEEGIKKFVDWYRAYYGI